jgi:hypothetical protein
MEQMSSVSLATQVETRPYPPSWLDRLTERASRIRGPVLLVYAAAALLAMALFALNDWLHTGRGPGSMYSFHFILAIGPIYTIALLHLLDERAARALERMRILLNCDDARYAGLRYRLTTLPADKTLLSSLAGAAVGATAVALERLALPQAFRSFVWTSGQHYFIEAWLVLTWFVFGALFYHTYHQLRLIGHIYTEHTRIDLDQVQPLFHFSRVSALTAVGLLLLPYGWYATVPGLITDAAGIAFGVLFPAFALLSFLWPLVGAHNLLVDAKDRALAENSAILQRMRVVLYGRASGGELGDASALNDALTALRAERQAILTSPTWPWQPGTPRGVVAALLLPVAVWLIQWVIEQLLTR